MLNASMLPRLNKFLSYSYRAGTMAAYTLIQLLFAIAVASAIMTYSYSHHNSDLKEIRNEKVAFEMQRILEAAIVYRGRNTGAWPANMTDLMNANLLPTINSGNSPWGKPYRFARPDGNTGDRFNVTTEVGVRSSRQIFNVLLPNVSVLGLDVTSEISASGKLIPAPPGALIMDIVQHFHVGMAHRSVVSFCFPRELEIYNACKLYNRKHGVMASISAYNSGMMEGGKAYSVTPNYGMNFSEVYLEPRSGSGWCYNFHLKHFQNAALGLDRGAYAELTVVYYCKPGNAGVPAATPPTTNNFRYL